MALVLSTLQTALQNAMLTKTPEPATAATNFANAYQQYTATANAGPALPVFTTLEFQGIVSVLVPVFSAPQAGNPGTVAAAWLQGIIAFWTTTPPPGVLFVGADLPVPAAPGPTVSALTACLTSAFTGFHTEADAAALLATCLDTATRGFIVPLTISGVPTPTPIT
jgi:hypothetical protein